jgi:hypothetical protein
MIIETVVLASALAASVGGHVASRRFVRERLRFVDAAQKRRAPWIAGFGAAVVAAPVVALLPFIGAGTALLFGLGVGSGVAIGARDIRRGTGYELPAG